MPNVEYNDYPIEPDPPFQLRLVDAPINPLLSRIKRVNSVVGPYAEDHAYEVSSNPENFQNGDGGEYRWVMGHRLTAQERIEMAKIKLAEMDQIYENIRSNPEILFAALYEDQDKF